MISSKKATASDTCPQVIHIGFAGARSLYDDKQYPHIDREAFEAEALTQLREQLGEIGSHPAVNPGHFFCGISQIAIGGDMVFARACAELGFLHRIFLPQSSDVYLTATGSSGALDFSPEQQAVAQELLNADSVVQEMVVSTSADRYERFEDTNLAIVAEADLLVCLLREETTARKGGTSDLMERARARGKPVIELYVGIQDGGPVLRRVPETQLEFSPPTIPSELNGLIDLPAKARLDGEAFGRALKGVASEQARWKQAIFRKSALWIIGTHVFATVAAVLALDLHHFVFVVGCLLVGELLLLVVGFVVHQRLHHSQAVPFWAFSRLVAEFARSVRALTGLHVSLDYLFALPLPDRLEPLLRTINVLHLRSTRRSELRAAWEKGRDNYVRQRLDGDNGQIAYYAKSGLAARRKLLWARYGFLVGSLGALTATSLKFGVLQNWLHLEAVPHEILEVILGSLAILLPILAVAGLSLAGAFDLEARKHTSEEMDAFLIEQRARLIACKTRREFECLLQTTELRLLGETSTWYSRRAFIGVA